MYHIIGKDGRQYGPVTTEQLRGWIAENRANAQTLVQAEGVQEWKPLGSFPEFATEWKLPPVSLTGIPPISMPLSLANPRASNKIPAGICDLSASVDIAKLVKHPGIVYFYFYCHNSGTF